MCRKLCASTRDAGDAATVVAGAAAAAMNLVKKEVAGSDWIMSELEEEDPVGNKRKLAMTGFKDQHDPDFVDDDVYEYNSGDDMDDGNVDSLVSKEVEKIKDRRTAAYYKRKKFWCPYYTTKTKLKDGLFEHLVSHAGDASKSGKDAKIRA
ncbi:PAX-interacting protein 1 [Hordeum vulgare]|nr:PAX-interacting protein 1 [Hordeum vulgare]